MYKVSIFKSKHFSTNFIDAENRKLLSTKRLFARIISNENQLSVCF